MIDTYFPCTCVPLSQWDVPLKNIHALTLYTYKLVKRTFTTGSYVQYIIIMDVTDVTRLGNQQTHLLHSKDHKA
jgi:hypothetical protein